MKLTAMRYLCVILFSFLAIGCATSPDVKSSTDVPGQVAPPRLIYKVDPDFPPGLRREGVTGVVAIEATIDRFGRLLNPRVSQSSDSRLDDSALAAVRQWRFKPATLNGEAVEVLFQVQMRFSIP